MTQSTFTNHDSTNLTFNFDNFNCYLYFATFSHPPPPPTAKLKKKNPSYHKWIQSYVLIVSDYNNILKSMYAYINIVVSGMVNLLDLFLNILFLYRAKRNNKTLNILMTLPMSLNYNYPITAFCSFLNC